jgi:DNA repair exonuclease SbcCD ATPase subunit
MKIILTKSSNLTLIYYNIYLSKLATSPSIFINNKRLIERISKEFEVSKKKLTEELVDKRERRMKYDAEHTRLREEIDKRQKEIEVMQAQAIEPLDMDILRMKARKEFEMATTPIISILTPKMAHKVELEEKQEMYNKIKEERDELKRSFEFLNTKHDNLKYESQREEESRKLKYKEELQTLIKENQKLQSAVEMSKDKELLRQCRRELEESKRRTEEYQKECNELRSERDAVKSERNELIVAHIQTSRVPSLPLNFGIKIRGTVGA